MTGLTVVFWWLVDHMPTRIARAIERAARWFAADEDPER